MPLSIKEKNNECSWKTSGCSFPKHQNIPKNSGKNSEKSTRTIMTENCNLLRNNLSVFRFFSASERPNVSGWDGTFHELKRGNCKNEVQRLSCWRRELVRSNHDIPIKPKIPGLISSIIIYYNLFLNNKGRNT